MNSNSENPRVGRLFQIQVQQWFQAVRKEVYQLEVPIAIGNPAKPHKFDLANSSGKTVVECKCYTWTETGNVPSAKMRSVNEAAFYLSFLSYDVEKCIVMAKATHPRRNETLAEYYYRINHHLLGDIKILEYDTDANEMRLIGEMV